MKVNSAIDALLRTAEQKEELATAHLGQVKKFHIEAGEYRSLAKELNEQNSAKN